MTLWEPKFNNLPGMTLTCWTTAAAPPSFSHSVVCDSVDHWFAPVKRRGELGFSCLLHCSTLHAIITVHQSLTMLKCLSSVAQCSPNMALLQTRYAGFSHPLRLILRAGLISFIIRCSGCFHMLWHSATTDVVEVTYRLLHGECQRCVVVVFSQPAAVSAPCKDKRPGGVFRVDLIF